MKKKWLKCYIWNIQPCIPPFIYCPKVFLQSLFEGKKTHSETYKLCTIHIHIKILNMYGKNPKNFSFFFFTNKSLLVPAFTSRKWLARMKTNFLQGMKHWYFWFNQNIAAQLIFQHHISPTWYFHVICRIPIGSKHWIKSNGKDTLHKV